MAYLSDYNKKKVSKNIENSYRGSTFKKEIKQIALIIEEVLIKITEDTDVLWTDYDNVTDLKNDINKKLLQLKKGDLKQLKFLKVYFLPTAVFQEIAISNKWEDQYLDFAKRFNLVYTKITNSAEFIIYHKWEGESYSYFKKIIKLVKLLYNLSST
jgi:hypothetical protein